MLTLEYNSSQHPYVDIRIQMHLNVHREARYILKQKPAQKPTKSLHKSLHKRVSLNWSHYDWLCRSIWKHYRKREMEKGKYQISPVVVLKSFMIVQHLFLFSTLFPFLSFPFFSCTVPPPLPEYSSVGCFWFCFWGSCLAQRISGICWEKLYASMFCWNSSMKRI